MSPQDEIQTELLREILKWTKFSGMKAVKEVLISTLETPQERLLYQLSNGSKGSVELCKITKIASTETVTRHWKTWGKLGIGENMSVQGGKRFRRAFDLEELGIEVPKPESGESDDQVQQLSDKKAE
jgi:hypothetical protein